jgi:hypothetical protein
MKYLFVIPQGGFSNICHIIWKCYEYCIKYNRILVIDSRYTSTFRDDIRKYLIFKSKIIFMDDIDCLFNTLKDKIFFPSSLKECIKENNYKIVISRLKFTKTGYIYKITEENIIKLTIDLRKDYSEDVLFFSNCGGGVGLLDIFQIIEFSSTLKNYINNRLQKLPSNYISIHIRNTDRKTDLINFIKKNEYNFKNKSIFLASDNYKTIEEMKKIYNKSIYTFSNIPDINGKPIHENNYKLNIEEFVLDCISDMILLSFGKEYYYSCLESGYSKNVQLLRKNIDLLHKLLIV